VYEFCKLVERARGDCLFKPPLELLDIEASLGPVNTQFLADPMAVAVRCTGVATRTLLSVVHRTLFSIHSGPRATAAADPHLRSVAAAVVYRPLLLFDSAIMEQKSEPGDSLAATLSRLRGCWRGR
jgi:hypothetical protein